MASERAWANLREFFSLGAYFALYFLLGIVLIALFLNAFSCFVKAEPVAYSYGIPFDWRVVDGDTISTKERPRKYYRVVGYDAPETTRPRCEAELLHGAKAREFFKDLLGSPGVLFLNTGNLDRYGRSLVYLWVNGKRLDQLMIDAGYGVFSNGKVKPNWCQVLKARS